jgi:hypothetical protein
MKTEIPNLEGAVIKSVSILTAEDCPGLERDEYCGYRIVIETDRGTVQLVGCHDMTPSVDESADGFASLAFSEAMAKMANPAPIDEMLSQSPPDADAAVTESDEPRVHSHLTDSLPNAHPLAFTQVYCAACRCLVHAANNECMQTWVEFSNGAVCSQCVLIPDVLTRCETGHRLTGKTEARVRDLVASWRGSAVAAYGDLGDGEGYALGLENAADDLEQALKGDPQ